MIFLQVDVQGVFFKPGLPFKSWKYKKIYVNVDSLNLGFPYFKFLGGAQCKKTPCKYLYPSL